MQPPTAAPPVAADTKSTSCTDQSREVRVKYRTNITAFGSAQRGIRT